MVGNDKAVAHPTWLWVVKFGKKTEQDYMGCGMDRIGLGVIMGIGLIRVIPFQTRIF
jgi:hypothetical protein